MAETKKQRMEFSRFIEIFQRYSFEEKEKILAFLKEDFVIHGQALKSKLNKEIRAIDNKIS